MLSILIPVYNYDVRRLVGELQKQATGLDIPFEIILMDDASKPIFQHVNKELENLNGIVYVPLEHNIGRSEIRNKLAGIAVYANLLFMDCDSQVVDHNYLAKYLPYLDKGVLVCGGRIYDEKPPIKTNLILHWKYGSNREVKTADQRNIDAYSGFQTNNFLIPKSFFQNLNFDERLRQYGHEDTLFGEELRTLKLPLSHIDNPLLHEGLENSDEFLSKTKKGIENLVYLYQNQNLTATRLIGWYELMNKIAALPILNFFFESCSKRIMKNLKSANPNLLYLDWYKLFLFSKFYKN